MASDFKVSSWNGYSNYECRLCVWSGLGLDRAIQHKNECHPEPSKTVPIGIKIYDAAGNVIKERDKEERDNG